MIKPESVFFNSKEKIDKSPYHPQRSLVILIAGIFFAEVMAMIVLYYVNPRQYWIETLLDASIMVLLIFPILYYFHVRPLYIQTTERKRSETLLRKVLENLPVGVWIVNQAGKILHGNQASLKIWGGARYVGMDQYGEYKAWNIDTGKSLEPDEWGAARAIQNGETVSEQELEIECFDGSHKIIMNSAVPIYENEAIQGAIVVNRDITERKQAEQALAKSEALFKTVFQVLPVGAWITDESGKIIYGNPAGQQIWAGARYVGIEQFGEYKAWWAKTGQPIGQDEWAVARAVRNGDTSLNEEIDIECFDGSHKQILNSAIPVRDEGGHMYGVFVINEDITQRKQAEQALIHSNELIEKAFNSIDVLIAYMDRDFNFISVNEAYSKSDGRPVEFFPGKNHFELYPHPENQAIFQRVVEIGEPYSVLEKPFEYPDHPERKTTYWNWRLQPVRGADGNVQGVVLSLVDVTERKLAELQLERQNQELQALSIAERKQRQLAETLNAISQALSQSLNIENVMNTLLEYVCKLVPSDRAYIAISEDETNLTLHAMRGYESELDPKKALDESYDVLEKPYLQEIISTRKSLLIPDTSRYPGWKTLITREAIRSWMGLPIMVGSEAIGVLALASCSPDMFTSGHIHLSEAIVSQASVAIQNAWLFEQVRAGHERLQSLSRRLLEVQESERRYIARELHDVVSQNLTALMFGLRQVEQEIYHPENILLRLTEVKQLTDQVLEELHRLAMGLRPASLDYLGLGDALGQLVKEIGDRYGLTVHFKTINFPNDQRFADIVETNVYRIVQEALTNAIRHANPKNIDVIVEQRDEKLIVIIEDDGASFDTAHAPKKGHLGLMGMQERAQMMSGTVQIESIKGHGTTIVLEIPYVNSNHNS